MEDAKENKHKITIIGADNVLITEKQKKALKKKKKKKLKSIGKRHPEFELTYDMMLGIRYAVSLSEPSVTTTATTRTRTVTATHTITNSTRTATSMYKQEHLTAYNASSSASTENKSYKSYNSNREHSNTNTSGYKGDDSNASSNYPSSDDSDSDLESAELESEFLETKKYKFPSSGSDTTPAHQMSDFKFKDYCPQIFRQLREWFRISTEEYLITICGDFKLLEFISNSKSGQFFFFSHNSQFIIKTMTRTESIFLRKILPSYYTYVSQQPDTLLPKFYGMHRVKRKKQKIYFLIQQNVFYSDVDDIHDQYDLKGSTQGRRATKAERKKGAILKDLDWVDEDQKIKIGPIRAKLFKDQLKKDSHWLRTEKIMDYSLLVGIHYRNKAKYLHLNDIAKVVLDHSYDKDAKFAPELHTVEEDKEDDDEEQQYDVQEEDDDDDEEEEEDQDTNLNIAIDENNHCLKIVVTPTPQPPDNKPEPEQEGEDQEETERPNRQFHTVMIKPSTTEHTGTDEESEDHDNDRYDIVRTTLHSLDIDNMDNMDADVGYGMDYIPNRRRSAPMIVSPNAKPSNRMNMNHTFEHKKVFKLFNFGNLSPTTSASPTLSSKMSPTDRKNDKKNENKHSNHIKSQSLQNRDLITVLDDVNLTKLSLRSANSAEPIRSKSRPLTKIGTAKSSTSIFSAHAHSSPRQTYRGHISVKHPKRYKRKTAAEMQFAVEDIQIPKGIKHELNEDLEHELKQEIIATQQTEETKKETNDENVNNNTGNTGKAENDGIETQELDNKSNDNNTSVDNADICPWTTYHGGMAYENFETNKIGNEIYFVGIIDVLQKYNKRKKLENWIKKMKYDKRSISAAPPDLYAQRMCDFFDDKVV